MFERLGQYPKFSRFLILECSFSYNLFERFFCFFFKVTAAPFWDALLKFLLRTFFCNYLKMLILPWLHRNIKYFLTCVQYKHHTSPIQWMATSQQQNCTFPDSWQLYLCKHYFQLDQTVWTFLTKQHFSTSNSNFSISLLLLMERSTLDGVGEGGVQSILVWLRPSSKLDYKTTKIIVAWYLDTWYLIETFSRIWYLFCQKVSILI